MRVVMFLAMAIALLAGAAAAGPNAGGTILVHSAGLTYEGQGECGQGVPPQSCVTAVSEIDDADPDHHKVWKVYAAFPDNASPRLKGITVGIHYDEEYGDMAGTVISAYGPCAEFELATSNWPHDNSGTSLVWTNTQTGHLTEVYWFAGYNYSGNPTTFVLIPHPEQGGDFADDGIPSVLDPITGYGTLGFNTSGQVACPGDVIYGACCVDENCTITTQAECTGDWQGAGTICEPSPCCHAVAPRGFAGNGLASPMSLETGAGTTAAAPTSNPCPGSDLLQNDDGTFETGYTWNLSSVAPPYYGAFAEGFSGTGTVCGLELILTTSSGYYAGQTLDAYVWGSDGASPTEVLSVTTGIGIETPGTSLPFAPVFTAHDFAITNAAVQGEFFAGYWGNWPGAVNGWFVGADLDGSGSGEPRTNIAPGTGYPEGWQNVCTIWGTTASLGIRVFLGPPSTPVEKTSWGRIKSMYKGGAR